MKTEAWNELFAHHQCQCADFVYFGGITLASTSVRRKPNAFNLLHQMRLMGKLGGHVSIEARLSQPLCQLVFFSCAGVELFEQGDGSHASWPEGSHFGLLPSPLH